MLYDEFLKVATERRTAKIYNEDLDISNENLNKIFEFTNTAPTSMGLESWRGIIFGRGELKKEIISFFLDYNIPRGNSASHLFLFVAKKEDFFKFENKELNKIVRRNIEFSSKHYKTEFDETKFENLLKSIEKREDKTNWSIKQCYIALSYLILSAKSLGIDTTPVEGMQLEKLNDFLIKKNLINDDEIVTLSAFLGYVKDKKAFIGEEQLRIPTKEKFTIFK